MAELEPLVPSRHCLGRRPASKEAVSEIAAREEARNKAGARLEWSFRVADARRKLSRLYPQPSAR
jgi:hypothetical protein